jgi:hypothetical protein
LHTLGWKGDKFYVNSATGWSVDRVDDWARRHLGIESWDGSVPASAAASACGSSSILGLVSLRMAVQQQGYGRDAGRAVATAVSASTSWHGLPYVASQEALQAGIEQHRRRVSAVRRKAALERWQHG